MKPFDQLTERGQMGRLLKMARFALAQYDMTVRETHPLIKSTNALFRVIDASGTWYVLRVCALGEHDRRDHEIEALWLHALACDTSLSVPRLYRTRAGDVVAQASAPGVPQARDCMLFSWVPGKTMEDSNNETPKMFEKLGTLSAQLHQHAAGFGVPTALQPMRWDKAFYHAHEPVVVYASSHAHLFTTQQLDQIRRVQTQVDTTLAALFAANTDGPMIIHGDLHTGNVHVHAGELYPLDFEDLMWGFPAQDIAVTLYGVRRNDDYADLRAAFQRGYEQVRPWPLQSEQQLETLFTARLLMFINYCANQSDDPELAAWLPKLLARLDAL